MVQRDTGNPADHERTHTMSHHAPTCGRPAHAVKVTFQRSTASGARYVVTWPGWASDGNRSARRTLVCSDSTCETMARDAAVLFCDWLSAMPGDVNPTWRVVPYAVTYANIARGGVWAVHVATTAVALPAVTCD